MPAAGYVLIGLLIGALLGVLFGWLQGRNRAVATDDRLATELRRQLAQREGELAQAREQLETYQRQPRPSEGTQPTHPGEMKKQLDALGEQVERIRARLDHGDPPG